MLGLIEIMVPFIVFAFPSFVISFYLYLRSKERRLLIEKSVPADVIKELYSRNGEQKENYLLIKIGIIAVFFGLGIGIGIYCKDNNLGKYWTPMLIFVSSGIGLILANTLGIILSKKNKKETVL